MAKVGLKYPIYGKLQADGSYTNGKVIAKAIKASVTAESNDVKLYADDNISESDKSFKGGKIALNVDDLTSEIYADLLGHTYDKLKQEVLNNGDDIAPFIGVGFYGQVVRNNNPKYLAKYLYKVQFAEPADETETKGDTVNYQTPTIEGDIFKLENGDWKSQAEFSTEAEAREWLKGKAGFNVPADEGE